MKTLFLKFENLLKKWYNLLIYFSKELKDFIFGGYSKMVKKEYSAGIVSKGFWFLELKKFFEYMKEGKSEKEIKELQEKENIFSAPSKEYGKRIYGEISKRVSILPEEIKKIFLESDIETQKIINLLSAMMCDKLLSEYIYSSYRSEILLGTEIYLPKSVKLFIEDKAKQNEEVAKFKESTIKRMQGSYGNYLKEAGLLEEKEGKIYYRKIYMDYELENIMKDKGLTVYIKALKGES